MSGLLTVTGKISEPCNGELLCISNCNCSHKNLLLIKFCFPGQIWLQRKCDKTLIAPLVIRYQHFQNSASLVFENVDIFLGKPRKISKLLLARQASRAKVLISYDKGCDKCIIQYIPTRAVSRVQTS